jgi:hypothetical protein
MSHPTTCRWLQLCPTTIESFYLPTNDPSDQVLLTQLGYFFFEGWGWMHSEVARVREIRIR